MCVCVCVCVCVVFFYYKNTLLVIFLFVILVSFFFNGKVVINFETKCPLFQKEVVVQTTSVTDVRLSNHLVREMVTQE